MTERPACTVDGCTAPQRSLGYCGRHYARQHRHGSPHILLAPSPTERSAERPPMVGTRKDDLPTVPNGGTVTLEEWKRLRSEPRADVHIVVRQTNAPGVVA